ncbi:hypothetical protein RJT34_16014 [Clitoria ternatea]|uniref:Uncharacterized protein n=1 Tax=Clitoria ternatea TaxID=43366 RepID=A0AAN9J6N0_CLITE
MTVTRYCKRGSDGGKSRAENTGDRSGDSDDNGNNSSGDGNGGGESSGDNDDGGDGGGGGGREDGNMNVWTGFLLTAKSDCVMVAMRLLDMAHAYELPSIPCPVLHGPSFATSQTKVKPEYKMANLCLCLCLSLQRRE